MTPSSEMMPQEHFGHDFDDRRAANAGDAGFFGASLKPSSSDHCSVPMTLNSAPAFPDRCARARWPRRGAPPRRFPRLQRRGRWARSRRQCAGDCRARFRRSCPHRPEASSRPAGRAFGKRRSGGVCADMAGDARHNVEPRAFVQRDAMSDVLALIAPETASANGAPPSSVGSMPRKKWCMTGLPTNTASRISVRATFPLRRLIDQCIDRLAHGLGDGLPPPGFIIT